MGGRFMTQGRSRMLWFAGLWAISAAATAIVAYALRWVLLG